MQRQWAAVIPGPQGLWLAAMTMHRAQPGMSKVAVQSPWPAISYRTIPTHALSLSMSQAVPFGGALLRSRCFFSSGSACTCAQRLRSLTYTCTQYMLPREAYRALAKVCCLERALVCWLARRVSFCACMGEQLRLVKVSKLCMDRGNIMQSLLSLILATNRRSAFDRKIEVRGQ